MIADIIAEIERQKIDVTIYFWGKISSQWRVTLEYTNEQGDNLKVERKNRDLEAAIIAAYEAIRQGMTQGMQSALPAPVEPAINDGLPL